MKHWRTIIALAIDLCLNFLVFPGCRDIFCCNFCPSARYWWNKIVVSMLLTITVLSNCYWMDRLPQLGQELRLLCFVRIQYCIPVLQIHSPEHHQNPAL